MPITLNVGLSKKIGLPDYGSLGASCNVQVELDGSLLRDDLERFHEHVRGAFVACRQAVNDELTQHRAAPNGEASHPGTNGSSAGRNGSGANGTSGNTQRRVRRATTSQIRAIESIVERQQQDLAILLRDRFGLATAAELSLSQASDLIDELKGSAASNGSRR